MYFSVNHDEQATINLIKCYQKENKLLLNGCRTSLNWGFKRWNSAPASLILLKVVGERSSAETSWSDRCYKATAEQGALSVGYSLGMSSDQFMTPLTGYKFETLGAWSENTGNAKTSSPRSRGSENPQHLAHVWSQERYDLPWQPALLRAFAGWLVSHKENTLRGFAEDFIPKWKIFTHIKLKKILC